MKLNEERQSRRQSSIGSHCIANLVCNDGYICNETWNKKREKREENGVKRVKPAFCALVVDVV